MTPDEQQRLHSYNNTPVSELTLPQVKNYVALLKILIKETEQYLKEVKELRKKWDRFYKSTR